MNEKICRKPWPIMAIHGLCPAERTNSPSSSQQTKLPCSHCDFLDKPGAVQRWERPGLSGLSGLSGPSQDVQRSPMVPHGPSWSPQTLRTILSGTCRQTSLGYPPLCHRTFGSDGDSNSMLSATIPLTSQQPVKVWLNQWNSEMP